jgi:hypothetical protein
MFDKKWVERQIVEANLRTLDPACDGPPEPGEPLRVTLGRGMKYPADKGYAKYLVALGYDPHWAGFLASYIVAEGRRKERDASMFLKMSRAFRFLAKPGRGKKAFLRNARVLLEACEQTNLLELWFTDEPGAGFDFLAALRWAAEGDESARLYVTDVAGKVAASVAVPRGPKITAASAAHEYILDMCLTFLGRKYTWNYVNSSFEDALSQATKEEFGLRKFDPRPAYRRLLDDRNEMIADRPEAV